MLCPNCKKEVTTRFCPDCGAEVNPIVDIPPADSGKVEKPENFSDKKQGTVPRKNGKKPVDKTLILWIGIAAAGILLVILASWGARALFDAYRSGLEWLFYN